MKIFIALFLLLIVKFTDGQLVEIKLDTCNWLFKQANEIEWQRATVPGSVHSDLLSNKRIPDPHIGTNEHQVQWIDTCTWFYTCDFYISPSDFDKENIELAFKGLDTYASVYVNNSLLLVTDNMFRLWKTNIKQVAKPGKNNLRIKFDPAVSTAKSLARQLSYTLPGEEKVFVRKAQYQFGWDWGPRLITCGIWQSVFLNCWNTARIINIQAVQKKLTNQLAEVQFSCNIESSRNEVAQLTLHENQKGNITTLKTIPIVLKKGSHNYLVNHYIINPKKWWCNGLGKPYMYRYTITMAGEKKKLDEKEISFGLRTIELVREKDSIGSSFYFKLNGQPLFIRGANYIPQDNFVNRLSKENYQTIISDAKAAHMNMLRVWGGGIYEQDAFYNECDKSGLLVWQDFMFACAMYPGDNHFIKNITEEAGYQVQRLRNHPSIALWCGNNEISEGWQNWGWQKEFKYSAVDSTTIINNNSYIFDTLLRQVVQQLDPGRDYYPSSPTIGWGHKESYTHDDSHYWGVWWGMEPFENYNNKTGRFVSEYGFQAMPALTTLEKMGVIKNTWTTETDSAVLKIHQKHPKGFETITAYMARDYKIPYGGISHYAYVSQLLQADGLRMAIEAHRRKKPHCMGTLLWQLNDCWPSISWSIIDYYKQYKASYYQVKRSFEDIIFSITQANDSLLVYVISDNINKEIFGSLDIIISDVNGNKISDYRRPLKIGKNESKQVFYISKQSLKSYDENKIFLHAQLADETKKNILASSNYYFAKPKDLHLQEPKFSLDIEQSNGLTYITLTSNVLAKNVMVSIENCQYPLSDNYFDLLPGIPKTIYLSHYFNRKTLLKKIKLLSLIDTFK